MKKACSYILFQYFLCMIFSASVMASTNAPNSSGQTNHSDLNEKKIRILLEKETGSTLRGDISFTNLKDALLKVKTSPVSPAQALILVRKFAISQGKENTMLFKAIEKGKYVHCFIFYGYYFFPQHSPLLKRYKSKVKGFFVDMTNGEVIYIKSSYIIDSPYSAEESILLFD